MIMVEIEFIKETETYKVGDIVKASEEDAKEIIKEKKPEFKIQVF